MRSHGRIFSISLHFLCSFIVVYLLDIIYFLFHDHTHDPFFPPFLHSIIHLHMYMFQHSVLIPPFCETPLIFYPFCVSALTCFTFWLTILLSFGVTSYAWSWKQAWGTLEYWNGQTRDSKYDRLEYKRSSRQGHVCSANLWGQINIDHGNYFEITHVLPWHRSCLQRGRLKHCQIDKVWNVPLSTMSSDAGVSSSFILDPSYRNLKGTMGVTTDSSWISSLGSIRQSFCRLRGSQVCCDSPNASHIFPNLCRIGTLKLAKLGVLFDLEENFLARWAHHLHEIDIYWDPRE